MGATSSARPPHGSTLLRSEGKFGSRCHYLCPVTADGARPLTPPRAGTTIGCSRWTRVLLLSSAVITSLVTLHIHRDSRGLGNTSGHWVPKFILWSAFKPVGVLWLVCQGGIRRPARLGERTGSPRHGTRQFSIGECLRITRGVTLFGVQFKMACAGTWTLSRPDSSP